MTAPLHLHLPRKRLTFADGYRLAGGVMIFACVVGTVSQVLVWGLDRMGWSKHDSTDAPGQHSGLSVKTDHLTGCQYLVSDGTPTPRMDQGGHQVCGV